MNAQTILASAPKHPLDEVQQRLLSERFDLMAGKAAEWEESKVSMWCWVAARLIDEESILKCLAAQIGMWAIKAYVQRDAEALKRLANCWEAGGYDGISAIAGSTKKKGRKDLLKVRNAVMTRLIDEARGKNIPFCDASIKAYASFYGIKRLSDETVKAWRDFIGPEAQKFHIKRKRGPKKGGKQFLRASGKKTDKHSLLKHRKPVK